MTTQPLDLAGMAQDVHNMGFLDYQQALALINEAERLRLELAQREELAADLTERLFHEGKQVERLRDGIGAMADFAEADRDRSRESLRVIAARLRALLGKE